MKTWVFSVDDLGTHVFLIRNRATDGLEYCFEMKAIRAEAVAREIELTCQEGTSLVLFGRLALLEDVLEELEGTGVLGRLIGVVPTDLARFSEDDFLRCARGFRARIEHHWSRKLGFARLAQNHGPERRAG
jgi:hypothetical protein